MSETVTRAKVAATSLGPRTLLQIEGLDGVVAQVVELLLPPGYSARPLTGADVTVLQVLGTPDHLVAIGGDATGYTIGDLAPGEFGLTDGQQRVVFRTNQLELVSPTKIILNAPIVECTHDLTVRAAVTGGSVGVATHTHTETGTTTHAPTGGT